MYNIGDLIYIGVKESFLARVIYDTEEYFQEVLNKLAVQDNAEYKDLYHSNNADEFFKILDKFNKEKYCYGWKEITEEQFYDMLGCLPPEKRTSFPWGSIFRMSEYMTGNITSHFMEIWDKYYQGSFDTSEYSSILDVKDLSYEPKR